MGLPLLTEGARRLLIFEARDHNKDQLKV